MIGTLALAGCGEASHTSSAPRAASSQQTNAGGRAAELRQYASSLSAVALSVTNVVVDLASLPSTSVSQQDLATLGKDAAAATTALRRAQEVAVDPDLTAAATGLIASMGTLGELASSPAAGGTAARYEAQYSQGSHAWNGAVSALCAAAGSSAATAYEVPLAGS